MSNPTPKFDDTKGQVSSDCIPPQVALFKQVEKAIAFIKTAGRPLSEGSIIWKIGRKECYRATIEVLKEDERIRTYIRNNKRYYEPKSQEES